jgi:CubicO group peptidase (beta-lactamase class C family)
MQRREFFLGALAGPLQAAPFEKAKLDQALAMIAAKTSSGEVSEAALVARRGGHTLASLKPDRVFVLASISKPMTVTGVMRLVERGQLRLDDRVRTFLPEFTGGDRDAITVRQLLTHTSGLPDMLPENVELRKRHAPLADFVAATCRTPLLFKPGTQVRYQSMGILLASAIAERITGMSFRDFLAGEVFRPAGMRATSLGLGTREIAGTARIQVEGDDDWNGNSPYWRNLGAPWGDVHSTAADVTRFLDLFLHPNGRVLQKQTARAMIANQTGLAEPWGFGWEIKPETFGKACSPATFGHYGASGTVAWADPQTDLTCVLLTTKPLTESKTSLLIPASELVAGSVTRP